MRIDRYPADQPNQDERKHTDIRVFSNGCVSVDGVRANPQDWEDVRALADRIRARAVELQLLDMQPEWDGDARQELTRTVGWLCRHAGLPEPIILDPNHERRIRQVVDVDTVDGYVYVHGADTKYDPQHARGLAAALALAADTAEKQPSVSDVETLASFLREAAAAAPDRLADSRYQEIARALYRHHVITARDGAE